MTDQTVTTEQHVYYHNDYDGARINVGIEKNTKGYNWNATVTGAKTVAEAILLLNQANSELKALYGVPEAKPE